MTNENNKNLTIAEQLKTQLNTPKTETRIILEQEDLYPDLGYEDINYSKGYGPCSTCGVSNKTFQINMDLRNAAGKHRYGSASNTTDAMNAAAAILRGDGGWEGDSDTGVFTRANREDLVKKINGVIAEHIEGEGKAKIEQLHNVPS